MQPMELKGHSRSKQSLSSTVLTTVDTTVEQNNQRTRKCPACPGSHSLESCSRFLETSLKGHADFLKSNRLWFRCLGEAHRSTDCRRDKRCEKDGCKYRHHTSSWRPHSLEKMERAVVEGAKEETRHLWRHIRQPRHYHPADGARLSSLRQSINRNLRFTRQKKSSLTHSRGHR